MQKKTKKKTECVSIKYVIIRTSKNYHKKSFKNYKKSTKIEETFGDLKEWIIMKNPYQ